MEQKSRKLISIFCTLLLILAAGSLYYFWYIGRDQKEMLKKVEQHITAPKEQKTEPSVVSALEPEIVPDTATKKQLWSRVQKQFKDTVVQVFSQVAEFNWLEPYKSPNQSEGTGSAFFINPEGELITNAHVVNQAKAVSIQIPSLGKRRFDVDIVGISADRDLALLQVKPDDLKAIKQALGTQVLPYLTIGNSDSIHRADKIMALGYPLGQQGLKSTTGVVSGREHLQGLHFIQISAPLNPGNSGGPSLNNSGQVIGVNSAGIMEAQNVGYIIPSNEVKLFLRQLRALLPGKPPILLRKPFLGVLFINASDSLTEYLHNPQPGGLYVVDVYKGSPLQKAGVQAGDMIYAINGHAIDIYGEMNVEWNLEDKISLLDYIARLTLGEKVNLVIYREGKRKDISLTFTHSELAPIRVMYPGYEPIDYEILGGLVFMQLALNHVLLLAKYAPDLMQYADFKKQLEPALVVSHVFLNSAAYRTRALGKGALITHVNKERVRTLEQLRSALLKGAETGFITLQTSENIFTVLPVADIMRDEEKLAATYFYPLSSTYQELKKLAMQKQGV